MIMSSLMIVFLAIGVVLLIGFLIVIFDKGMTWEKSSKVTKKE